MGYILKETPHPPPSTRGVLEGSEDRSLGTHIKFLNRLLR